MYDCLHLQTWIEIELKIERLIWKQKSHFSFLISKVGNSKDVMLKRQILNVKFIYSEKAPNFAKSPPYFCPM